MVECVMPLLQPTFKLPLPTTKFIVGEYAIAVQGHQFNVCRCCYSPVNCKATTCLRRSVPLVKRASAEKTVTDQLDADKEHATDHGMHGRDLASV